MGSLFFVLFSQWARISGFMGLLSRKIQVVISQNSVCTAARDNPYATEYIHPLILAMAATVKLGEAWIWRNCGQGIFCVWVLVA